MTIGKELKHVEDATLQDVKDFFYKHYTPVNAILVVAGNVTAEAVKGLAEKWFGPIPSGTKYVRNLPVEPPQTAPRTAEINANVPIDALYKCWHICSRLDDRYYVTDLITEILSGGGSSRLFQALVKEKQLFSNIECSHSGSTDAGLLSIEGKLVKGVQMKDAEAALMEEIYTLQQKGITEKELQKVKNKTESSLAFEDMSVMSRATNLAMYELLGDAELINTELNKYQAVTTEELLNESKAIFNENNCSTLYYYSNN
jgi:predicted Zn-dependent peptidase